MRNYKGLFIAVILSAAFYPQIAFSATNITSNVENGGNLQNSSNETYYVLSGQNKYNFWQVPQDIATNYTNGTLIFGNDKKEASSSHTFNFRTWGAYNYTASFTAKDIYLTGNITSKASAYTGYFNLYFNGTDGLKAEGLNLNSVANNTAFVSDNGDVVINSSNITTSSASTQIIATNGNIKIDDSSTLTIRNGGLTTNADIDFIAGKNISLGTTNITTNYGGANVNFQAGQNLDIKELNLTFSMPAGFSNVYGSFIGENITIQSGRISQDLSASLAVAHLTFGDDNTKSINLGDTYLHLMAGTAAYGGSSATFKGESLTHNGTIVLGRDGESVNDQALDSGLVGASLDFRGITGNASINEIKSRKGQIYANSDLSIGTLTIRQAAQGITTDGNKIAPQTDFYAQDGGTYTIGNLNLLSDNATSQAYLYFHGGNEASLNITNANLGINSYLDAQSITTTNIQNLILASGSSALFNRLNIINNGSITMDATSSISIKASFDIDMKQEANIIGNYYKPILSVVNFDISNINTQFDESTQKYTYRFIDTTEGISYTFTTIDGTKITTTCNGSGTEAEKTACQYIKDSVAIYDGDKVEYEVDESGNINYTTGRIDISPIDSTTGKPEIDETTGEEKKSKLEQELNNIGLTGEIIANNSYIGINFERCEECGTTDQYSIGDIRYYIWLKGGATNGDKYVEEIASISPTVHTDSKGANSDIFDWLNALTIDYRGITWTGSHIINYDFNFFKQIATQLQNTLEQLASIDRKNASASSTRLTTDIAKAQRLVKLSRRDDNDNIRFADYIKSLSNKRYAKNAKAIQVLINASNNQASDYTNDSNEQAILDSGFLYKFSNRHSYASNIWANALGSMSFVSGGYGVLYGMNAGYDRFIGFNNGGIIIGGYGAYGRGTYNADLIANRSHNVNAGIYTRTFIGNGEIDVNISYTLGLNSESIDTYNNEWFSPLAQAYSYNTHTFNLDATYGYIFGMQNKSLVFKPYVGVNYYLIYSGDISGSAGISQFAIASNSVLRNVLALSLALETRQYFSKGSYWFLNVAGQPQVFVNANDVSSVRYVSGNANYYPSNDSVNVYLNAIAGGEVQLKEQFFINFALGGRLGLAIKDINLTGNLGARYAF